jgi:hypothetical protein
MTKKEGKELATNENINRARLRILLILALPCFSVDLKGISAIRLNNKELFHVFLIYQEIFISK